MIFSTNDLLMALAKGAVSHFAGEVPEELKGQFNKVVEQATKPIPPESPVPKSESHVIDVEGVEVS
jgi:hypothetical protein